ncbi:MAG: hypothetical protein COA42_19480 [Alteromonadaceae bacterium]|nr:MAG: hypothetical protein COA42_19480 [Alteromonadaceae bacterium]
MNRYEKIINYDFSAGDQYWQETQAYWQDVRQVWAKLAQKNKRFKIKKKVDNQALYHSLFSGADKFKGEHYKANASQAYITEVIAKYVVPLP